MSRGPLEVGEQAPDFTLIDQFGQEFTLSEHRGDKAVLIVFYPWAFSGVCTGELSGFRDRLGDVETDDCTLATISCDAIYSQRSFADRDGLFFPLLSDFWPHGEVTAAYGVLDERTGAPRRSSFLVGKDGTVLWSMHNELMESRDLDAHAAAVRELV